MSGNGGESTRLIHAGSGPLSLVRTVGPPIQKGSTVLAPNAGGLYSPDQITYGRNGLATQATLTDALAELEHASSVKLFPSGLAALTGAMLAVVAAGDDVLVTDVVYKPTRRFCDQVLRRFGVSVRYYPARATADQLMAMAGPKTRLIVMESPGSLTFEMHDAPAIAAAAASRGILTLMDNTWAAGWYFKPLDHGVDISVQALTKYAGGHADVFMGSAATRDPKLDEDLDRAIVNFGWCVGPDDAYQVLRGLRTMPTRMARHQENALTVARWLSAQPKVLDVLYPALPSSPDHALWRRDYSGAAGLFAIVLKPCSPTRVEAFLDALKVFGLGFSWGGFESLALNADPQFSVRENGSAAPGPVVRLNIGLEDAGDLIEDLDQAMGALAAV